MITCHLASLINNLLSIIVKKLGNAPLVFVVTFGNLKITQALVSYYINIAFLKKCAINHLAKYLYFHKKINKSNLTKYTIVSSTYKLQNMIIKSDKKNIETGLTNCF